MTFVGGVRDGFSSKPDVAASFLPTDAAVANHFWTLRRPRSRLLRQRLTDDEVSFPTTAAECSSQVPFGMERGEQLALWVKRASLLATSSTLRGRASEAMCWSLNRKLFHIRTTEVYEGGANLLNGGGAVL